MSGDRQGAVSQQPRSVTSGEAYGGPVDPARLTPLERAAIYPGLCCVCGKVIPMAAIRCDEHERIYQAVRA